MPRKHNRAAAISEPLGAAPPPLRISRRLETEEQRETRIRDEFGRRRVRNDRRADERIREAVDWDICCIPGCGFDLRQGIPIPAFGRRSAPDPSRKLPLCIRHQTIIWNQANPVIGDQVYQEMRQRLARQRVEKEQATSAKWNLIAESNGAEEGQIYFVRLNDLVKVGWSLKLRSRLKAYGASAEILCHYPASRADETLMHRQLRPYLAKGREWYQDCPLIADVVSGIIERHGEPCIFPQWTQPKTEAIRPRRTA